MTNFRWMRGMRTVDNFTVLDAQRDEDTEYVIAIHDDLDEKFQWWHNATGWHVAVADPQFKTMRLEEFPPPPEWKLVEDDPATLGCLQPEAV